MKKKVIKTVNNDYLSQLRETVCDTAGSSENTGKKYLEIIGDPYSFLCGETTVNICFTEGGNPLDSCLLNYFRGIKNY